MECTGKIKEIVRTLEGKIMMTAELEEAFLPELLQMKKHEKLDIKLKKFRRRRSLDANALMWECIGNIAREIGADKWEIYLQVLKKHGQYTYIVVKPNAVEATQRQWRESEVVGEYDVNGQKAVQMLCFFGSSTYNTKEFSQLLDGIISDMEMMGLETPTSEKMQRSLELWEERHEQKNQNAAVQQ